MRKSTVVYTGLSILSAALFFFAASGSDYTVVERVGGTIWVFILLMIILMPVVSARTKKRTTRNY